MNQQPLIKALLIAASLLLLSACASKEIKGDGVIDLTLVIQVSEDVNPDDSGRASPIFLQIFELSSTSALNRADYLDVYRDARAALGADLINTTEIGPLFPGSEQTEKLRFNPATTAVGFIGEFNQFTEMNTSQTLYLEPGEDREVVLRIDGTGLHAQ